MRILFVHAAVDFSIGDVSRGYRAAMERAGHDIADYVMPARFAYHARALPPEIARDQSFVSKNASECIVLEAMYHRADLMIVVSGLNVHPIALWLCGQVDIPVAVILTESPYDDVPQAKWLDLTESDGKVDTIVFTNDAHSAAKRGWTFLPPSFDPTFHHPDEPDPEMECDVMIVGTGWVERQSFLEAVNWEGINFRIYGVWPGLTDNPNSPIHKFYQPRVIDNTKIAKVYASAKINLNFHRASKAAFTPGPRVFELAGCGVFSLSDSRKGLKEMFGAAIPTFKTPQQLEALIRLYLKEESADKRHQLAMEAHNCIRDETFDNRAATLMAAVKRKFKRFRTAKARKRR